MRSARRFLPALLPALALPLAALSFRPAAAATTVNPTASPPTAAQPATPQPAIPLPSPLPPNQPVTYRYSDAEGFGSITFTDVGPEMATGGRQLSVSLLQNGTRFNGSGLTVLLADAPRPLNNLITFTVVAPWGTSYFFQGKMGLGVEFQGSGTYHPVSDPTVSAPWGLLALPLPGPNPGPDSGIQGMAVAGPISPVERPGQPNTRPLPGAIITVQPAGGGAEIARATADANGQFRIPLAPGSYLIVPLPPQPGSFLPRGTPQPVTVRPGVFTQVTVQYDTGIR